MTHPHAAAKTVLMLSGAFLIGCTDSEPIAPETDGPALETAKKKAPSGGTTATDAFFLDAMERVNAGLAAEGADYRVAVAEYFGHADSSQMGNTVIAKDVGNKRLADDFVPNDPRREPWSGATGGSTDDITYAVDQTTDAVPFFGGLTGAQTTAAIDRAMETWDGVTCSDLAVTRNPSFGLDVGRVAFILSGGAVGSPFNFADVQHAGWRDLDFGGGVLGVTFTFVFIDAQGNLTDADGDGQADVSLREIYYDPSFAWADDGVSNVDVETVALHEAGHGLSQAHFGTVRIKNDGTLKASPRAVMNALYAGPFRELAGNDNGGHCGNWGQWPNN